METPDTRGRGMTAIGGTREVAWAMNVQTEDAVKEQILWQYNREMMINDVASRRRSGASRFSS